MLQKAWRPSGTAAQLRQQAASRHSGTLRERNTGTQSCSRYARVASCPLARSLQGTFCSRRLDGKRQTKTKISCQKQTTPQDDKVTRTCRAQINSPSHAHTSSSSPNLFTDTGAVDIKALCSLWGIPPFSCFKGKQMKTNLILLAPPLRVRLSYALLMC